jgi:glycerophosphoryl diester phosphodiesterase
MSTERRIRANDGSVGERKVLSIGHRGAAAHAPENTLAGFHKAISLGADLVEADVQRTRDGRLAVIHDKFVDRTTNGTGAVTSLSWDELRALDAGRGERVPSLRELLAAVAGRAGVMLESKTPGIGQQIYEEVYDAGFPGSVIYASFLHADLLAIRNRDADALTLALLEGVPISGAAFALDAKANYAGLCVDSITAEFVALLHDAGVKVFLYTVNDVALIRAAKAMGADGIISDWPERVCLL